MTDVAARNPRVGEVGRQPIVPASVCEGGPTKRLAQRALSDALLQSAHRVEASTDIANVAEQRSLEKAGFLREGVLRSAQFRRDGIYHDLVMYARTRDNAPSVPRKRGR